MHSHGVLSTGRVPFWSQYRNTQDLLLASDTGLDIKRCWTRVSVPVTKQNFGTGSGGGDVGAAQAPTFLTTAACQLWESQRPAGVGSAGRIFDCVAGVRRPLNISL